MNRPILPAILSCSGEKLTDEEKYIFEKYNPLGINLFSRNITSPQQLKKLTTEITSCINRNDVIIAIDQEGGRVRRLSEPYFRNYTSAYCLGDLPLDKAIRATQLHAFLIATDLYSLGINLNYAPVLDLSYPDTTEALKSRCFSSDAQKTTILGKTMIETYSSNGIIPCIKHLPGHGRATNDPHLSLPQIDSQLIDLEQDFLPFRNLNHCPAGMTAHIVLTAIDNKLPITQSPKGIQEIIRDHIGFTGLLISDAIDMHALTGSISQRAILSLSAGCDVICYAGGKIADINNLVQNLPIMSDKSMERFAKLQKILNNKPKIQDIDLLADEYKKLVGTVIPYEEKYDATEVLNLMYQNK